MGSDRIFIASFDCVSLLGEEESINGRVEDGHRGKWKAAQNRTTGLSYRQDQKVRQGICILLSVDKLQP